MSLRKSIKVFFYSFDNARPVKYFMFKRVKGEVMKRSFVIIVVFLFGAGSIFWSGCSDDNGTNPDDDNGDTLIVADTIPPDSTHLIFIDTFEGLLTTVENAVAISGDYMYLANRWHIVILDISDPENPVTAGRYPETSDFPSYVTGISLEGVLLGAYVMNGSRGQLHLIDITDKVSPTALSVLDVDRYNGNMVIDGDYAYLSASDRGVFVVDVSDPSTPSLVNTLSLTGGTGVGNIHVKDGLLAASMTSIGSVRLLDVSDPMVTDIQNSFFTQGNPKTSFLYDGYLLVANGVFEPPSNDGGFLIFDLDVSLETVFTDSVSNTSAISVFAEDGYAYLTYAQTTGANDYLRVYSIHDRDNPVFLHQTSLPGDGTFVISKGDYIYAATRNTINIYRLDKYTS